VVIGVPVTSKPAPAETATDVTVPVLPVYPDKSGPIIVKVLSLVFSTVILVDPTIVISLSIPLLLNVILAVVLLLVKSSLKDYT